MLVPIKNVNWFINIYYIFFFFNSYFSITSLTFIALSIDLPNVAMFLNLTFWFLILLSAIPCKSALRSIHGFKIGCGSNCNILFYNFFKISALNLNRASGFDHGISIFLYCLELIAGQHFFLYFKKLRFL